MHCSTDRMFEHLHGELLGRHWRVRPRGVGGAFAAEVGREACLSAYFWSAVVCFVISSSACLFVSAMTLASMASCATTSFSSNVGLRPPTTFALAMSSLHVVSNLLLIVAGSCCVTLLEDVAAGGPLAGTIVTPPWQCRRKLKTDCALSLDRPRESMRTHLAHLDCNAAEGGAVMSVCESRSKALLPAHHLKLRVGSTMGMVVVVPMCAWTPHLLWEASERVGGDSESAGPAHDVRWTM